jgi:TonB-dependent receptor
MISKLFGLCIKGSFYFPLPLMFRSAIKFTFLSLTLCTPAFSQQFGGIRGQVVDSDFGQPIGKASVIIMDTPFGAITDEQGNFTISGVPPGVYGVQTRASGYIPKTMPQVAVTSGAFNDLQLEAVAEIEEMEELVVPGELEKSSTSGLLVERQNASAVMDMMGQDLIARVGASTAGDAIRRMVGASVVDGKYVVVRGMPDRYVNTLLNGGRLPSSDPDKRAINVDLFPASTLESLNLYKTFTPDQPADFTGGSVDIRTRQFPDKPSFGFGTTVEYNSQATFNPDFLVDPNGGTGVFGMRANGRMIPESVTSLPSSVLATQPEVITNPTGTAQAAQINDAMRKISPVIAPRTEAPGPNVSVNLQGGDTVGDENDGQMGVLGAFSWRKKYTFDPQGTRGNLILSPGQGGVITPSYEALNQAQGNQDLLYGSLLSLSGQWEKDQTVGANLIFNEGATSSAATRTQEEIVNNIATQQILQYGERSLLFAQFHGDHLFPEANGLELTWNGGLGQAKLQEPNQTQFSYIYNPVANLYDIGGAQAFQRELTENSYYTIADLTLPFLKKDDKENIFKTGWYYDNEKRPYQQSSFQYKYGGSESPAYGTYPTSDDPNPNVPLSDVFLAQYRSGLVNPAGPDGSHPLSWSLGNTGENFGTYYNAFQQVAASYLMVKFEPFSKLKLQGGTRFENTVLGVNGAPIKGNNAVLFPKGTDNTIKQLDLLPAVGATFELCENVNLRFAWSQTLARPSFKEIGPVVSKNFAAAEFFVGNPFLNLSHANNYDFRTEWFPRSGEVISASLFYKDIQSPMEMTSFNAGGETYQQYENFPSATIYGVEVEARKRLDQVSTYLKNFTLSFNFSQIKSQVQMPDTSIAQRATIGLTGDTRPLQGQPNYLINAGINYDNEEYKTYMGLFYNVTGPFLYSVGNIKPNSTLYTPDIYEQPAPSLDFNITQGLTENWKITFRGKNLLNPIFQRTQNFGGQEFTYSSYTKGWDLSLNTAYSF